MQRPWSRFLVLLLGHGHGSIEIHKLHSRGESGGHAKGHLRHLDRAERLSGHPRLLILLSCDMGNGRGVRRCRRDRGDGTLRRRRRFALSATIIVKAGVMGTHAPAGGVSTQVIRKTPPSGKATPESTASALGPVGAGRQIHVIASPHRKGDGTALWSAIGVDVEEG